MGPSTFPFLRSPFPRFPVSHSVTFLLAMANTNTSLSQYDDDYCGKYCKKKKKLCRSASEHKILFEPRPYNKHLQNQSVACNAMELVDLPHDIFLLVVSHFSDGDIFQSQAVSRKWMTKFADPDLNLHLLKSRFPRAREVRLASAVDRIKAAREAGCYDNNNSDLPPELAIELEKDQEGSRDWTALFASVARRYHHLRTATPRLVLKIRFEPKKNDFFPVETWDRWLRLNNKTAPFHYRDPSWCYSQDDGLLAYASASSPDAYSSSVVRWRLLDLATNQEYMVPFDHAGRIVRRVRISGGVLMLEWCEEEPFHQLNDGEPVHRHFATAFDVVCKRNSPSTSDVPPPPWTWNIAFKSEWKLHFLGLPLNHSDRFFSAHTATHYVVYVWQPNRSPWGEDDPIESLIVWDISCSSKYRPSEDPSGAAAPRADSPGPKVIRRMTWSDLEFYGVRQRSTPKLRHIALDEHNLYIVEEEHRWATGPHSSLSPPRVHQVKSTAIPIIPGPVSCVHISSSPKAHAPGGFSHAGPGEPAPSNTRQAAISHTDTPVPVQGPCCVDECGADGDVNMSFCWRAEMRLAAYFADMAHAVAPQTTGWLRSPGLLQRCNDPASALYQAPCWRHEDFPYLTVGEIVDSGAGVRITARHCFMLETLSVHVRPVLCVKGLVGAGSGDSDHVSGGEPDSGRAGSSSGSGGHDGHHTRDRGKDDEPQNEEVQFTDDMWDELMGKGLICGDERWVIGEDRSGRITIVRF